jgi:iron complex outermembrane receptor protein
VGWNNADHRSFGEDPFTISINPPYKRDTTHSAFAQYDVMLVPDKFRLTAGSKFERHPYTGFEYQPQIRMVWTPNHQSTIWAAASRSVGTPNRIDAGLLDRIEQVNPAPPPWEFLLYTGNSAVKAEILHAYEVGYRLAWHQNFSLDATAYYNDYDGLAGLRAPGTPIVNPSPFFIDLPVDVINEQGPAQTHGLEIYVKYTPVRPWNVSAAFTELRGTSPPGTGYPAVTDNPLPRVVAQSRLDLTRFVNVDAPYF